MKYHVSAQTQEVIDGIYGIWNPHDAYGLRRIAAAALRVVAKQVHMDAQLGDTDADAGVFAAHNAISDHLIVMAAELDGTFIPLHKDQ